MHAAEGIVGMDLYPGLAGGGINYLGGKGDGGAKLRDAQYLVGRVGAGLGV